MTGPATSGAGRAGWAGPSAGTSDFNRITFLVKQILGGVRTATLVKIVACTRTDSVEPVGFVDVIPLVNMIDGLGNSTEHGTIYHLPYFRVQGGKNAIIADPQKDDIGIAVFSDRDISAVKDTLAQANPGSRRRFDMADGLYIGGVLNAVPTQYVQFTVDGDGNPNGMNIVDANGNVFNLDENGVAVTDVNSNTIVMDSDGVKINGVLFDRDGNISNAGTYEGSGEGTFDSHTVGAHTHGGVTAGSDSTDTPTG